MTTPTAILSTVPAGFRCKRRQAGFAEQQLQHFERQTSDFTVKQLSYGVLWAHFTGRISGTLSMAIRRATPWQAAQLIAAMANDGITLIRDVPAWLNQKGAQVLA